MLFGNSLFLILCIKNSFLCSKRSFKGLGRILRAIIVQFRCPRSGTTLKPPKSIVFYALRTNLLVVTRTNLQFFYSSCSNVQIFHSFEIRFRHFVYRKLHVIYIFCVSCSLTAGGRFPGPIYLRFFIAISKRNKW